MRPEAGYVAQASCFGLSDINANIQRHVSGHVITVALQGLTFYQSNMFQVMPSHLTPLVVSFP